MAFKPVQVQDLKLTGSGISSGASSITVQQLVKPGTSTTVTMTDFGSIGYGVIEPGTPREENFSFTGVTQNANGTATFTGCTVGLDFVSPYSSTAALKYNHAGNSIVRISNTSAYYSEFSFLENDQTFTGINTFPASGGANEARVSSAATPSTLDEALVTVKQLNDTAIAGAPDATTTVKGIVEIATQAEVDAGDDTGSTTATVVVIPSTLANVIQDGSYVYAAGNGYYTPAFLTGDTGAQSNAATWAAVTDGSFKISVNGVDYNLNGIDFTGDASMADVASTIQTALRTATGSTETVVWSTNKFIISSVNTTSSSAITVTSTVTSGTVGTDISGAGASDWMDCDTGNGTVTNKVLTGYTVTLTPAITAYVTGQKYTFKAEDTNVGAATIDFNGLGAKSIKSIGFDLPPNTIIANGIYDVVYDGTNFQLLNDNLPVGTINLFAGSSANISGSWLLCDGSAVSRTTYARLFSLLSTTYGAGNGSTTFNLPNLKGKVPVGLDSGQTEFDTLGETGGAKTHTITEAEMPAHTHVMTGYTEGTGTYDRNRNTGPNGSTLQGSQATNSTGGGGAHNNLQPYLVLHYMIKA